MKKDIAQDGNRAQFSSGIAIFFATLSSAVGLGNIWKFPYMIGENGGGAFLFIYLLCVAFVGLPLLIFEFYMGRRSRKNVVGAFESLAPNKHWRKAGLLGCLGAFFMLFFYTTVAGWIYSYVFKSIRGDFDFINIDNAKSQFFAVTTGPWWPIIWQFIVIGLAASVLVLGVKNGIEKITKTLMPVLFGLIIFCVIKSLSLPNSIEGVKFLFNVDFSKITTSIILTALGLSFFKLALGMGSMVTYGSYFTKETNIIFTAMEVAIADTIVSLLVGLVIFPAVFSLNLDAGAGPGLLFLTMPIVFSKMPFGKLLLILFFILSSIAATCSMLAVFEVPVAYFSEEKNISRKKSVLLVAFIVAALGATATLSASPHGLLSPIKVFGLRIYQFFDFASSNLIFPTVGLLVALFVGYFNKKEDIFNELSNNGTLKNEKIINVFYFIIRTITPILLIGVFINTLLRSLHIINH